MQMPLSAEQNAFLFILYFWEMKSLSRRTWNGNRYQHFAFDFDFVHFL